MKYKDIPLLVDYIKREDINIYNAMMMNDKFATSIKTCNDDFNANMEITTRGLGHILETEENNLKLRMEESTENIKAGMIIAFIIEPNRLIIKFFIHAKAFGIFLREVCTAFTLDKTRINEEIFGIERIR